MCNNGNSHPVGVLHVAIPGILMGYVLFLVVLTVFSALLGLWDEIKDVPLKGRRWKNNA